MGSYDGAETCELVGLYLLFEIRKIIPDFGLYRDDGLGVAECNGNQWNRTSKKLHALVKKIGLSLTIVTGKKVADFLDVVLNLETGSYKLFNKPNNKPVYVHKLSNHPKNVISNLPTMIQSRLVDISSNEEMFNQEKEIYNDAIKDAGYEHELKYKKPAPKKSRRLRKIYWFNPPFSKSMSSDLTKMFNTIMIKNFPKDHKLHKLINKNNTKISYSCTPNMGKIIAGHNKKILNEYYDKINKTNSTLTRILDCTLPNIPRYSPVPHFHP